MFDEKPNYKMQDSYMEGFVRGLYWPDQWEGDGKPGGPFVMPNEQSRKENEAWCKGWNYGHHCKLTDKKVFEDPYPHMRDK